MKLNEITAGKKIWVIVTLEEGGNNAGDIYLEGAFSSEKAANIKHMQLWLDAAGEEIENAWEAEQEDNPKAKNFLPILDKLAKEGKTSQFEKLASDVGQDVLPSWQDHCDFYTVVDTKLF